MSIWSFLISDYKIDFLCIFFVKTRFFKVKIDISDSKILLGFFLIWNTFFIMSEIYILEQKNPARTNPIPERDPYNPPISPSRSNNE